MDKARPVLLDEPALRRLIPPIRQNTSQHASAVALRVVLAVIVSWTLGLSFLWQQHEVSTRSARLEGQHLSFVLAELVEQTLIVNLLVVHSMLDWIGDEGVQTEAEYRDAVTRLDYYSRLKGRTQNLPTVDVATFIAADGTVLNYSRSYPPPTINLSDRDYFIDQMAADAPPLSLGKAVRNRGTGEWTFYVAKAVYGASGSKLGVVITGTGVMNAADQFARMLRHHEKGGRGDDNAYLVRNDGILLASTNGTALGERVMLEQGKGFPIANLDSFGKAAGLRFPSTGVISASPLATFPAFVVTVTDQSAYLVEWWQTVWLVLGATLILSLLSVAIGWRNYRLQLDRERVLRREGERRVLAAIFGSPLALAALILPDRRILYGNLAFFDCLSGIIRDQKLVPGPEIDGGDALAAFLSDDRPSAEFALCVPGENCSRRYLRFSGARVDLVQGETAIALLGHDETLRMQAEAHIIQSSKLITLGEMATGMAHELNQPLNVIKMAAQSALFEVEDYWALRPDVDAASVQPTDFVKFLESRLQRVVEQVDRAASIIDHMRIFGRVPTGKPPLIDVVTTCRSALQLIDHQLRDAQIKVDLRMADGVHQVLFHTVLLEQVLVNLLLNARDAMAGIQVAKRKISIEVMTVNNEVMIMVSDQGPGIPPAFRDRIFEPFFTTKSSEKGTGLGLSISYGIMRDSGGRLDLLDSKEGCSFCIVIPSAPASKAAAK